MAVSVLAPFPRAGADTVSTKKAQASALASQLAALSVRASQAAEAYDRAQLHLQQVTAQLTSAKAGLSATSSQLGAAEGRVKQMAILSYMQGGAATRLSMLIPGSVDELVLRGTYVSAATGSASDAIDALRSARTALDRQQASLSAAEAQAQAAVTAATNAQKAAAAADAQVRAEYATAEAQLGQALFEQAQRDRAAAEQTRVTAALRAEPARGAVARATLPGGGHRALPTRSAGGGTPVALISGPPPPPPGPGAGTAIAAAEAELGKPYMYGGAGGDDFDCSGLTAWAWGHAGHPLPHSSEAQYYDTTHVSVADLQPGDLVFYGMPPHHVGLYVGNGEMINALHSGTNVEYDSIYIEGDLIGGGRVN
ncbi:MAG TPA: NlpC/P60 family protein [Acidimicrobiales bacterium]|nr:NlpC/P60 family protein [Acidimicrobiales bacterium]